MNKRGVSADIFKWVLGLVAGAIILLFFVRFAQQHVDVSDVLYVRELLEHFDDQLEAFGIADSSSKIIPLANDVKIDFQCDSIHTGDYTKRTNKIIFAPLFLEGTQINAWTQTWTYPFAIANLYYLSNDNIRHLLVYDDHTESYVTTLNIPRIFNTQMIHARDFTLSALKRESSARQQVNLIFFTPVTNKEQFISTKQPRINLVEVDTEEQSVTYHNERTTTTYYSDELLLGALFAPEQFNCLTTKARAQLHRVAHVYAQKAKLLQLKTLNNKCVTILAQAHQTLTTYSTTEDDQQLMDTQTMITKQNTNLEKNDCPTIY